MSELAYTVTRRPGESVIDIASPLGVIATMHVVYARALAAELARVADEGETAAPAEPVERSCFTCMHDYTSGSGLHRCRAPGATDLARGRAVYDYCVASGAGTSPDGMPTDRSIPCPGWSAKVTT